MRIDLHTISHWLGGQKDGNRVDPPLLLVGNKTDVLRRVCDKMQELKRRRVLDAPSLGKPSAHGLRDADEVNCI